MNYLSIVMFVFSAEVVKKSYQSTAYLQYVVLLCTLFANDSIFR